MNLLRKLARDSLWLLLSRIGAQICAVIVTYLLARRLSVDGFGEYSFILAMILIGNTLTTFGSDMVLIREIAAKDDFSRSSSALSLQLVLSFLFIGCVYLLAPLFPNQTHESISALRIYSLVLIPLAFFTVFTSILRGKQRMDSYGWLNFIIPFLQVVAILIFFEPGTSLITLACLLLGIQTLGTLLAGILCLPISPDLLETSRFTLKGIRTLFLLCLPIALISILGILYQRTSLVMLAFWGTASMTGLFSAAARIVEAARLGHIAAFTALYPALAGTNRDKVSQKVFNLSGLFLLVAASGGAVLLFLLAKPLIDIFFGSDYRASIHVLQILAFSLIPYTVSSFLSLVFLSEKKEMIILRILAISLAMQLILNFLFIPRYGAMGAGWAILLTEFAQAVLMLFEWTKSPLQQQAGIQKGVLHELSDPP